MSSDESLSSSLVVHFFDERTLAQVRCKGDDVERIEYGYAVLAACMVHAIGDVSGDGVAAQMKQRLTIRFHHSMARIMCAMQHTWVSNYKHRLLCSFTSWSPS